MNFEGSQLTVKNNETYKYLLSFILGIVACIGIFLAIKIEFNGFNINFVFSLTIPLIVTLSWGLKYGYVASLFGLMFTYPFMLGIHNGWGSLVPTISLFILILIQGYGFEMRKKSKSFRYNIYFLQLIFIIIKMLMYFILYPILIYFNPPIWYPGAYTEVNMNVVAIFALKGVVLDTIMIALSDALLLIPGIRRIFRLEIRKGSQYNTLVMGGIILGGVLFSLMMLWLQYYIIDKQDPIAWLLRPDDQTKLIIILSVIIFIILGGITLRFLEKNIEARESLELKNLEYEKAIIKIDKLNNDLEEKVMARTKDLNLAIKELEEFTSIVSHDLKAPLRAIEGYSRLIVEDDQDNLKEESLKYINKVQENSQDLIKLIDKLLDYSKKSKKELEIKKIDLKKLVNDVYEQFKVAYPNRRSRLILEGDFPAIDVDELLFKEAIQNILSNCFKFTQKKDETIIKVSVVDNVDDYLFVFADNGVGFNMKYRDKLFKIFQRLHKSTAFEGAGIGLSLVKKIIENHGGQVDIIGEINKGTKVFISLPKGDGEIV